MNSDSESPGNGSIVPVEVLPSSERVRFPMTIERECIDYLDTQLEQLNFKAQPNNFTVITSEAGHSETFFFVEIFRDDNLPKRFLIDVQGFNLAKYERNKVTQLMDAKDAFLMKFGTEIYLYLIYSNRPHKAYKYEVMKRAKISKIRKIKFISIDDICDFQSIIRLNFHESHLKEIQDVLEELLDLEIEDPNSLDSISNLKEQEIVKEKSELSKMTDDERSEIVNIILNNEDFKRMSEKS